MQWAYCLQKFEGLHLNNCSFLLDFKSVLCYFKPTWKAFYSKLYFNFQFIFIRLLYDWIPDFNCMCSWNIGKEYLCKHEGLNKQYYCAITGLVPGNCTSVSLSTVLFMSWTIVQNCSTSTKGYGQANGHLHYMSTLLDTMGRNLVHSPKIITYLQANNLLRNKSCLLFNLAAGRFTGWPVNLILFGLINSAIIWAAYCVTGKLLWSSPCLQRVWSPLAMDIHSPIRQFFHQTLRLLLPKFFCWLVL